MHKAFSLFLMVAIFSGTGAVTEAAASEIDFSKRLSSSFDTSPIAKQEQRMVTGGEAEGKIDPKYDEFTCARDSKKCPAEFSNKVRGSGRRGTSSDTGGVDPFGN